MLKQYLGLCRTGFCRNQITKAPAISNYTLTSIIQTKTMRRFCESPGSRKLEILRSKGDAYSKSTGVELKFEETDDRIDWDVTVTLMNIPELVRRCMVKYPSVVPTELTPKKVKVLLKELKSFRRTDNDDKLYEEFLMSWSKAYQENLDEIMFKNLSSYEP